MGFWGVGAFDNDDALDWLNDLLESSDPLSVLSQSLSVVAELSEGEFLEAPDCCCAIAAAEAVAALRGQPGDIPTDLEEWLEDASEIPGPKIAETAYLALERILNDSELKDHWQDSEDHEEWIESMEELMDRVAAE